MGKRKRPNFEYFIKAISPNKWDVYKRSAREWVGEVSVKSSADKFAKLVEKVYGPNTAEIEQVGNRYIVWLRAINERWLATFTTEAGALSLVSELMGY